MNVFTYLNYRTFLCDYYKAKKAKNPSFSYHVLALKAGFKSRSCIADVISGRRNLTEESRVAIGKALGLKGNAFAYFQTLVEYNQSRTHLQQNHYYVRLSQFRKRNTAKVLQARQYEYYSQWYHNTIRELAVLVDFKENYALLSHLVNPCITPGQAKDSVKLLLNLGLLKKDGSRYVQNNSLIRSGEEIKSVAIANFHLENLKLAAQSIESTVASDRDISCIVASLSPDTYQLVKDKIKTFRKELLAIAEKESTADSVYHISFQLFPSSKKITSDLQFRGNRKS